ncbi:MAG: cysteate synthase, partial [Sphingobacteriales bacterium]|nr:cysteate synthase [Sphingobacteriales bacterium]
KVLSNRRPPYGIYGGLFDALSDTQGKVLLADNTETLEAMRLFEQYEGVDIHPAAGVALASLMKEIKENRLDKKSIIMLNITGGGEKLFMKNHDLYYLKPSLIVESTIEKTKLEEQLKSLW